MGTEQSEDVQVMHEADEHFNIGVGSIRSEKYLFIVIGSKLTSETWVLDRTDPEGEFQVLWQREAGVDYDVDYAEIDGQAYWFVTHNASGPNFTLVTTPLAVGRTSHRSASSMC